MKKSNSLKGRNFFLEVLAKGVRIQDRYIRLYVLDRKNKQIVYDDDNKSLYANTLKLGITLNRQFGKAHERNKMRRRIKSIFSKDKGQMIGGYDIIMKPDKGFRFLTFSEEKEIIMRLLVKAGVLKR